MHCILKVNVCARIAYGSFDRYDFYFIFIFLHRSASDYICWDFFFLFFFFALGKHASILKVFSENGGGLKAYKTLAFIPQQSWGICRVGAV